MAKKIVKQKEKIVKKNERLCQRLERAENAVCYNVVLYRMVFR